MMHIHEELLIFFSFSFFFLLLLAVCKTLLSVQLYRSMELDSELSSKHWKASKTLPKINLLLVHSHVFYVSIWMAKTKF